MLELAKTIGGPGSLGFFILVVVASALWVCVRRHHFKRALVVVGSAIILYLMLALPPVALAIANALPQPARPTDEQVRAIKTLFVFGGDNNVGRIRGATDVYRLAQPSEIWLLDARFMASDLRWAGAPRDAIHVDELAPNTLAQVERVKLLSARTPLPIGIVVSRLQWPRTKLFADTLDVSAVIVAAPLNEELSSPNVIGWAPSWGALRLSRDAVYEHLALTYYRARHRL